MGIRPLVKLCIIAIAAKCKDVTTDEELRANLRLPPTK